MNESEIFINQIGYKPLDNKTVFLSKAAKGNEKQFSVFRKVKDAETQLAFTGILAAAPEDEESGGGFFTGDFSEVQTSGEYYVCVGNERSFDFKISNDVYDDLALSTLKYFTDSRCGQGICHTGIAEVYGSGEKKNVQGGWHDAGDYGRYVVAGTKTVMDLLLAYRKCPEKFSDFDLLAEVRFELEWLLEMQRDDGAVYHKISCYHFCAFINPEDEKDQLVIAPVSTAATADFAGCLAYASGFYKESDSEFADKLLAAALKAQTYLFSHDDEFYINPPEITTGGYGDRDVRDERYFALCALFAVTADKNYLIHALKFREDKKKDKPDPKHPWNCGWQEGFGWPFVSGYGTEILLEVAAGKQNAEAEMLPADLLEEIHKCIVSQAEKYLATSKESAFHYCSRFVFWGSNGAICDLAHIMLMAYDITGRKDFFNAAKAQIDYILGCNPMNYCYVTGAGTKQVLHPHHRPSGARGKVFPGMLSGGPCAGLLDAYAKEHLVGQPPLKCFADVVPSYSTNEVAIYWNSAFDYVLARVR